MSVWIAYTLFWIVLLIAALGIGFVAYQVGKWAIGKTFGFTEWETIFDTFDCDCVRK